MFHHVVEPIAGEPHINGEVEHLKEPGFLISIDAKTHTFFETVQNMWIQRIITSKTNTLIKQPLIRQYFGRVARKRNTISKRKGKAKKTRK